MFIFSWQNNKYTMRLLPEGDIFWHTSVAEIKKRNGRYHTIIKAEPVELTEKYHETIKIAEPIQKHFTSEVEAKSFIESYFKTFNYQGKKHVDNGAS